MTPVAVTQYTHSDSFFPRNNHLIRTENYLDRDTPLIVTVLAVAEVVTKQEGMAVFLIAFNLLAKEQWWPPIG